MSVIHNFLIQEFFPEHPGNIVIRNKYYPRGLTELQIYKYYMKVKPKLLKWVGRRKIMFFLRIDEDQIIVKRKHKGKNIVLTSSNYPKLITGRTNKIHVEHPTMTNYFVVDIDAGEGTKVKDVLKAANSIPDYLEELEVKQWEQLFSSPLGIQVIGYLDRKTNINKIRKSVMNLLNKQNKYLVNEKGRHPNTINLDMTPNYKRGLHIARYSLTKEGLICDDLLDPNSQAGNTI